MDRQRTEVLAADLHAASLHLLRRLRTSDQELGITPARLSALSVLVFGGPCTLRQLADAEQVSPPTMSRIVAALEAQGLARRQPDPDDARAIRLTPTAQGRRTMLKGRRRRVAHLAHQLRALPERDLARLEAAVEVLRRLEGRGGAREAG